MVPLITTHQASINHYSLPSANNLNSDRPRHINVRMEKVISETLSSKHSTQSAKTVSPSTSATCTVRSWPTKRVTIPAAFSIHLLCTMVGLLCYISFHPCIQPCPLMRNKN